MILSDKETIDYRLSVCLSCDKTKDMKEDPLYFFVDALGALVKDATTLQCTECSCPIYVKVRVPLNSCPLNKWTA